MEDGEAQIEVEQPAAFQENIVKSGSFDCCWVRLLLFLTLIAEV